MVLSGLGSDDVFTFQRKESMVTPFPLPQARGSVVPAKTRVPAGRNSNSNPNPD